jgi:thioredoxin reductase (NADPH)
MADRVFANPKITPIWNTEVTEVCGEKHVSSLKLRTTAGVESELPVRGLFVAIGHTPNSKFVASLVELDRDGYIIADRRQATSVPGIWAAGDVQDRHYRQAITAAASGCAAALEAERWLESSA